MSSDWPAPFQPVGPPPDSTPPSPSPPPVRRPGWSLVDRLLLVTIAIVVAIGGVVAYGLLAAGRPGPTATAIALATTPPPSAASSPPTATPAPSSAPSTSQQTPSATAGQSAPGPSASGTAPLATVPPDIAAQIDQVIKTVPVVRQLQPLKAVPYFMVSRDQFQADFQADFDKQNDPAQIASMGRALARLGLIPAGMDLRKQILDLNGGAVAAYYKPDTDAFYIISRTDPFGPLDRVYVAHEYTHALQDQHFNLVANQITDPVQGDAALAQLSVIEGDATDTMLLWARQYLTFNELLQVLTGSLDQSSQTDLSGVPPILSRQLTFPYNEGTTFVSQLQQQGGWPAVNEAIQHPPASTEQILHPDKYAAHETPAAVQLPDVSSAMGTGWTQSFVQVMGELDLQVFVAGADVPPPGLPGLPTPEWPYSEVAAGWNGDRLAMWEGPGGAWAIGWRLDWDTPADATEFTNRFPQLEPRLAGPAKLDQLGPTAQQVVIAVDAATLATADAALH